MRKQRNKTITRYQFANCSQHVSVMFYDKSQSFQPQFNVYMQFNVNANKHTHTHIARHCSSSK